MGPPHTCEPPPDEVAAHPLMDNDLVAVYWGDRITGFVPSARDLASWLERLRALDPAFDSFTPHFVNPQRTPAPSDFLSVEYLEWWIEREQMLNDLRPRQVMPGCGSTLFGVLSSAKGTGPWARPVEVNVACNSAKASPNRAMIYFPRVVTTTHPHLFEPAFARAVLHASIDTWHPDWGLVESSALLRSAIKRGEKGAPRVGWLTYLRGTSVDQAQLPAGVQMTRYGDGVIIEIAESLTLVSPDTASAVREVLLATWHQIFGLGD